jgi:hypothetical protein
MKYGINTFWMKGNVFERKYVPIESTLYIHIRPNHIYHGFLYAYLIKSTEHNHIRLS